MIRRSPSSTCAHSRRTTAGGSATRAAAATSPAPWLSRRLARHRRRARDRPICSPRRASPPIGTIVVYGDELRTHAPPAERLVGFGVRGVPRLRARGWPALGGRSRAAGRATAEARRSSSTSPGCVTVLAGATPEAAPAGDFLLFHVNFGVPEEYAEDHLPSALYLDTNWLEDPADWNRRSPEELERALRALGITTTRPSSCTAATPRATPTRSGRAGGPARSPRRAR